ncbi:progonadoliberin-1-like [Erpetoichthys calabaricus]|uniref:progonadoliberin-1-like n=1 Tax=Erpetoichthys calabaricus TaxID=27687 RepID=UPI00223479F0|nr:progonadoliberin-1-like [Erpetoichthys calabaricus]
MPATRSTVLWLVLALTILADICYGQHWSYGLRPGGKRDVEKMKDVLQDIPGDSDKFENADHPGCILAPQCRKLNGLKEVLVSLIEGEPGRKKV